MKSKKVKLVSYKRAISQIAIYEKGLATGKERKSSIVEQFRSDISPYLNKNGTLSKRALRSNKARQRFNKIISDFRRSEARTAKNRKSLYEARAEGIDNSEFVADNTLTVEKSGKEILDTFIELSYDRLMHNVGFRCGDVINLITSSDEVTQEDIREVAEYIQKDMNDSTPSFLKGELTKDKVYNQAQIMLDYIIEHNISTEDIKKSLDEWAQKQKEVENDDSLQ